MGPLQRLNSSAGGTRDRKPSGIASGNEVAQQQSRTDDDHDKMIGRQEEKWAWRVCLAFRLLNALVVRTYFNPDEHWQALEVAHRIVFGYGALTWEWDLGIRSYVHPLIFAALYKLLHLTDMDTPWLMARSPRLLQALFAAIGDLYLFKLGFQVFGRRAAYWTTGIPEPQRQLFCQFVNWFTFFCMVRTLSNSLETTLTTIAIFYWPDGREADALRARHWRPSYRQLALAVGALSCAIRPTNAIIWLYLGVAHLLQIRGKFHFLVAEVVPIGLGCLCLVGFIDRLMYGRWIITPFNFLKFNLLSPGGDFYGTHPWHWYFSQGFPAMIFTFLPISLAGMWWGKRWLYTGLIGWVLSVYSVLGHKEFRFVMPVLPLSMLFSGYGLTVLEEGARAKKDEPARIISSSRSIKKSIKTDSGNGFRWIILGLLITNVPTAFYLSMIHQRGSEAVMKYLADEASSPKLRSILFLMPCHSTPFYAALHNNVSMRFLDCSPSDEPDYLDEADRFKKDPMKFLQGMFAREGRETTPSVPSHVVLFDSLEPQVRPFLTAHQYKQEKRFFHSHFPVDRELQGYVLLFSL